MAVTIPVDDVDEAAPKARHGSMLVERCTNGRTRITLPGAEYVSDVPRVGHNVRPILRHVRDEAREGSVMADLRAKGLADNTPLPDVVERGG